MIAADPAVVTCPEWSRIDKACEGTAGTYTESDPVQIRLGALRIGDGALASVNAEIYSTIAKRLKKQSPVAHTVMVTIANGRQFRLHPE